MDTQHTKELNKEACEIIEVLGGTQAVSRICKVKPASVSGWKHDGIPDARLMYLKLAFPKKFKELNK
jgi:predicted aconitase